jgi:hypothetical protein
VFENCWESEELCATSEKETKKDTDKQMGQKLENKNRKKG